MTRSGILLAFLVIPLLALAAPDILVVDTATRELMNTNSVVVFTNEANRFGGSYMGLGSGSTTGITDDAASSNNNLMQSAAIQELNAAAVAEARAIGAGASNRVDAALTDASNQFVNVAGDTIGTLHVSTLYGSLWTLDDLYSGSAAVTTMVVRGQSIPNANGEAGDIRLEGGVLASGSAHGMGRAGSVFLRAGENNSIDAGSTNGFVELSDFATNHSLRVSDTGVLVKGTFFVGGGSSGITGLTASAASSNDSEVMTSKAVQDAITANASPCEGYTLLSHVDNTVTVPCVFYPTNTLLFDSSNMPAVAFTVHTGWTVTNAVTVRVDWRGTASCTFVAEGIRNYGRSGSGAAGSNLVAGYNSFILDKGAETNPPVRILLLD